MGVTELTIESLGPKGDGVHHGPRGRIYVERAIPGDRLVARVQRDDGGVPRGEILEVLDRSPYRQAPPCPHYDRCGNCTLQHLNEAYYRAWKEELVQEALARQGLRPGRWLPPIFLTGANRRRATFAVRKSRGCVRSGYYRRRSSEIVAIESCLVADPRLLSLRTAAEPFLEVLLREGTTVDVFVQIVGDAADMVITGPLGRRGRPDAAAVALLTELAATAPVTRLSWRGGEGEPIETVVAQGPVTATFGALRVALPPAAFLQPTVEGERALVDRVTTALPAEGTFADLFSGCGTFSGPMLARGTVDAFETAGPAVAALKKAAAPARLRAFRRDLFRHPLRRDELAGYDAVVFDPPRAGCPEQAFALSGSRVPLLVGVSCNPATFARDARLLVDGGYRLQSVSIVDQFRWSHHVEIVGVFMKPVRPARGRLIQGRR